MSRSSFEAFFPTAPKVLKDKRTRPSIDNRKDDPGDDRRAAPAPSSKGSQSAAESAQSTRAALVNGAHENTHLRDGHGANEGQEGLPGDILNGVGSASSESTVSSGFSHPQRAQDSQRPRKDPGSSALTPITNLDSPFSGTERSPLKPQQDTHQPQAIPRADARWNDDTKQSARPLKGKSKGFRVVYDPELDTSLTSKERRSRKPEYKEINDNVSELSTVDISD
jgi:[histone H3]-lysine4 N-trimethyltransferase SETD1